jgi:hypothetical protein
MRPRLRTDLLIEVPADQWVGAMISEGETVYFSKSNVLSILLYALSSFIFSRATRQLASLFSHPLLRLVTVLGQSSKTSSSSLSPSIST